MKTKVCYKCEQELPINVFAKNKSRKDGLNWACKECQKEYFKNYYANNKDKHKASVKKSTSNIRIRNKKISDPIKIKCCRCEETDKCCLDFHHKDQNTKNDSVSHLICHEANQDRLLDELQKCEVLCSRCHNLEHFNPNAIIINKCRQWYREFKSKLRCSVCNFKGPAGIHLHHTDTRKKEFTISEFAVKAKLKDLPKLIKEIEKTIPLCVNCHRKVHAGVIEL